MAGQSKTIGQQGPIRSGKEEKLLKKKKKKLGVGDFGEEGMLIYSALEDAMGGGAMDSIDREQTKKWQCNAPVWHCTDTFKRTKRVCMLACRSLLLPMRVRTRRDGSNSSIAY